MYFPVLGSETRQLAQEQRNRKWRDNPKDSVNMPTRTEVTPPYRMTPRSRDMISVGDDHKLSMAVNPVIEGAERMIPELMLRCRRKTRWETRRDALSPQNSD
jgi:hypothetical protein